jgi:hypothetical protein
MCSTTYGLKDFPVENSVPVTPSLNASIYEEIALDIQWSPKATEPKFIHDGTYANLGFLEYMDSGASSTTLRLNGNSFSFLSLQLCIPQHKGFLSTTKKSECFGELVMGFKAQNSIAESYLFLCIPILTRSTTTVSPYLEALRNGRLDGKPISMLSLLPSDTHYISYSTCLQRTEAQQTVSKQTRVLVFTEGLAYPENKFYEIARMVNPQVSGQVVLPMIQLPDSLQDRRTGNSLSTISSETEYKSLLRYSQYYPKGMPDSSRYREDNLNSYKCVPLEPSQNIRDGKIIVDTDTGELLSKVLEDKQEPGTPSKSKLTPALVEKVIAICISLVLIAFIFLILAYIIANLTTPNADSFFHIIKENSGTIKPVVFFSILSAVVFFVIGFFLSTWV